MALKTKIDLSVSLDWKTITIKDMSTGVEGYGSNQDPVNERKASSSGQDVEAIRIILTSPSKVDYVINLNAANAFAAINNGYSITNTSLGYTADEIFEEGIWKVQWIPFFTNSVTISVTSGSSSVSYSPSNNFFFTNSSYLKTSASTVPVYYSISSINLSSKVLTLSSNYASTTNASYSDYQVGYAAIEYIPIVKTIKDGLDEKVAALPNSNCPCKEKQVNNLMSYYLLYDAMFINASNVNFVKANYIYNILDTYVTDTDCKCNE
jgi:hypothetical protein